MSCSCGRVHVINPITGAPVPHLHAISNGDIRVGLQADQAERRSATEVNNQELFAGYREIINSLQREAEFLRMENESLRMQQREIQDNQPDQLNPRDLFAVGAMEAIVGLRNTGDPHLVAEASYQMANAMMERRRTL